MKASVEISSSRFIDLLSTLVEARIVCRAASYYDMLFVGYSIRDKELVARKFDQNIDGWFMRLLCRVILLEKPESYKHALLRYAKSQRDWLEQIRGRKSYHLRLAWRDQTKLVRVPVSEIQRINEELEALLGDEEENKLKWAKFLQVQEAIGLTLVSP